jgi:hypothetical protein
MAVYLDDNSFFKFVIVSDNPRPSKNNFTEKPPKDKEPRDIMSTSSSSPPPNNEKLDEKNQNSQEVNKPPEVKVFDTPNSNGDSTKEQKNEEKCKFLSFLPFFFFSIYLFIYLFYLFIYFYLLIYFC